MLLPARLLVREHDFRSGSVLRANIMVVFSGHRAFELLDPQEQDFALNTTVHYAPRAYEWMRDCKATDDGLTIASVGLEKSLDQLSGFSWDQVQSFPVSLCSNPPIALGALLANWLCL